MITSGCLVWDQLWHTWSPVRLSRGDWRRIGGKLRRDRTGKSQLHLLFCVCSVYVCSASVVFWMETHETKGWFNTTFYRCWYRYLSTLTITAVSPSPARCIMVQGAECSVAGHVSWRRSPHVTVMSAQPAAGCAVYLPPGSPGPDALLNRSQYSIVQYAVQYTVQYTPHTVQA